MSELLLRDVEISFYDDMEFKEKELEGNFYNELNKLVLVKGNYRIIADFQTSQFEKKKNIVKETVLGDLKNIEDLIPKFKLFADEGIVDFLFTYKVLSREEGVCGNYRAHNNIHSSDNRDWDVFSKLFFIKKLNEKAKEIFNSENELVQVSNLVYKDEDDDKFYTCSYALREAAENLLKVYDTVKTLRDIELDV